MRHETQPQEIERSWTLYGPWLIAQGQAEAFALASLLPDIPANFHEILPGQWINCSLVYKADVNASSLRLFTDPNTSDTFNFGSNQDALDALAAFIALVNAGTGPQTGVISYTKGGHMRSLPSPGTMTDLEFWALLVGIVTKTAKIETIPDYPP